MSVNSLVILATYNGEKYIRDIVSSIDPGIDIIVSDDSSTDCTVDELRAIERDNIIVSVFKMGSAVSNFMHMLATAPLTYDYYFLVDQDDVWCQGKADKVLKIMHGMELEFGYNVPFLVFSDAKVVDDNLKCISDSFWKYEKINPDFSKSFKLLCVQNVAQGATMVFNRALLNKVRSVSVGPVMHDWWLMLCASAFGHINFTYEKTILYRQHANNQVGAKKNSFLNLVKMFIFYRAGIINSILGSQAQARSFLSIYRDSLSDENIKFLEEYSVLSDLPFVKRKFFCFKHKLRKTSFMKTIGFYFLV